MDLTQLPLVVRILMIVIWLFLSFQAALWVRLSYRSYKFKLSKKKLLADRQRQMINHLIKEINE